MLTQVLKCLGALVQATPYHRLTPGIISKVIRSVKVYVKHRGNVNNTKYPPVKC